MRAGGRARAGSRTAQERAAPPRKRATSHKPPSLPFFFARMVADAERLAKEDADHVARVEARNEFESQLNQATEYASSTLMGNPRLEEIIKGLRAWLDLAPASTPVTVLRGKMLELEKAITRA